MKYSIIIVCYNAGEKLKETILSVLRQSYKNFEIIIKDAKSSDGSLNAIPNDERIRIFSNYDAGIYDGMNKAIEYITGDYVLFLNCGDSFYSNDVLKTLSKKILLEGDLNSLYFCDVYDQARKGFRLYPSKLNTYFLATRSICHQSIFFPSAWCKQEKYDLSYKVVSDFDYYMRFRFKTNYRMDHVNLVAVNYEGNGASETSKNIRLTLKEKRKVNKTYLPPKEYSKMVFKKIITLRYLKEFIGTITFTRKIYNFFSKVFIKKQVGTEKTQ